MSSGAVRAIIDLAMHGVQVRIPSPGDGRSGRPSTGEGKRALWLAGCGLALQPLVAVLVNVFDVSSNIGVLSALGLVAIAAGGVYAGVAVFRHGERSIFVLATLGLALLVAFFVIGELAVPH